ncbi:hypothetical protein SLEP1_g55137 [Rubroshorea leprosula]|uniref:Uncharacterized protein n=1 Tax=Rubroshorea leprosula TaxID=152421 RepID=A0AAV5MFL7_9ROSI|nr:hypothetical protein SLEP1_g55137 [Rubroshorea leprosula]
MPPPTPRLALHSPLCTLDLVIIRLHALPPAHLHPPLPAPRSPTAAPNPDRLHPSSAIIHPTPLLCTPTSPNHAPAPSLHTAVPLFCNLLCALSCLSARCRTPQTKEKRAYPCLTCRRIAHTSFLGCSVGPGLASFDQRWKEKEKN